MVIHLATDLFSQADGVINDSGIISCEVDSGETVVVGSVVYASTHVAQGMPKISVAGADQDTVIGVVTALGHAATGAAPSGAAGVVVSVALLGSGKVVKVVSNGTTTVGVIQKAAANGEVTDADPTADEHDETVGRALQTAGAASDELLIVLSS